jgi:hypothetical protein
MAMNPRLLRPTPTGFDPRRISGLVAWWDAQVASSYDIVTGVSEWRDLSGNGHALSQAVGNNQPTLSTINSRTAFLFDGSTDELVAGSAVLNATSASSFSFFGVTQIANTESGYIVGSGSAAGVGYLIGTVNSVTQYDLRYGNNLSQASSATKADNIGQVWSVTHRGAAGVGVKTAIWSLNGTLSADATTSSEFSAPDANLVIGNRPGGSAAVQFLAGRVGSILIYNRELLLTERQRIERWLGSRWGVTVA